MSKCGMVFTVCTFVCHRLVRHIVITLATPCKAEMQLRVTWTSIGGVTLHRVNPFLSSVTFFSSASARLCYHFSLTRFCMPHCWLCVLNISSGICCPLCKACFSRHSLPAVEHGPYCAHFHDFFPLSSPVCHFWFLVIFINNRCSV